MLKPNQRNRIFTHSRTATRGRRGEMNFKRCENRGTIFALFEIPFPLALWVNVCTSNL